jgi:prepilin-type processing-associated H-X9-DG protein
MISPSKLCQTLVLATALDASASETDMAADAFKLCSAMQNKRWNFQQKCQMATLHTAGTAEIEIMNGWNDVFPNDWQSETIYMKESKMLTPADTIIMGERRHSDMDDFWMDVFEVENGGPNNLIYCVQHSRHGGHKPSPSGGSNYLFGDGGVRYKKFGLDAYPINLWISGTDQDRSKMAIPASVLSNSPGLGHD